MKKYFIFLALLQTAIVGYSQVGIGTSTPQAFFNVAADKTVLFGADSAGAGAKFMWIPQKYALRAGKTVANLWIPFYAGRGSIATGENSSAQGDFSVAMGYQTYAYGANSIALGFLSSATGNAALSAGYSTAAEGDYSVTLGFETSAYGPAAIALGYHAQASGDYSVCIGSRISSNDHTGSVLIGDHSSGIITMYSPADNNFRARFANGYRLYTSSDLSTSCSLGAGDNAWTTTSDYRLKENLAEIDGEEFLKRIGAMRLTSWNYIGQDPATFRHYGPMAQDFFAAFGKDEFGTIGNDTTINQADFLGVNLVAIQALEKRTTILATAHKNLEQENEALRKDLAAMKTELKEIRAALKPAISSSSSF